VCVLGGADYDTLTRVSLRTQHLSDYAG